MNMHVPAMQRSLSDVVAEYDVKKAAMADAVKTFHKAGNDLKMAATIGGTFGRVTIDTGDRLYESTLYEHLLKSAWYHVYEGLNISRLASPNDKRLFEQAMAKPPEFTIDNIRATFGKYITDPRGNILRGLAEVFCGLDQAYKSHDKVKIGVKGLPKRLILSGFTRFNNQYGREKLESVLNALAAYQNKPLVTWRELSLLMDGNEDALLKPGDLPVTRTFTTPEQTPGRGIRLRIFDNGNGHLFFEPAELNDINKALAEFYGEVLCDTTDEKPTKKQPGTAVSKDLQYYRSPDKVVATVMHHWSESWWEGKSALEPSCGCGQFLKAASRLKARVYGVEVDAGRAALCKAMGYPVHCGNFLDVVPPRDLAEHGFDVVLMNPPFYGRHYAKHVLHAWKFLKPGGTLVAILPVTARYDHHELDAILPTSRWSEPWDDLPVGSFSESGTNINTTVLKIGKPE